MSIEERTINRPWIEQLAYHLKVSEYSLSATQKRMAAARGFLLYLANQGIDVSRATAAHEQAFLIHKLNFYRKRHGYGPSDLSSWRWGYTSGVHIVMRLAQGQWPPVTVPASPQEAFRRDFCDAYAQWLSDVRGLAARTIPNRQAEARRFLESLGKRGGDESLLAQITVADLDHYLRQRAPQLRRQDHSRIKQRIRMQSFR